MPSMPPITQAYTLAITAQAAPLSVLSFVGNEAMSEPYRLEVMLTSVVAGIDPATVLGRPARFSIYPLDAQRQAAVALVGEEAASVLAVLPARVCHGLITAFDELSGSLDETRYRVVIEPRLADLSRVTTSRLFQNESVPGIIEAVLRQAGFTAADFAFHLRMAYPNREYVTQYEETSLAFIQRLASDAGLWFRFDQTGDREVVVFGDDLDAYARTGVTGARRDTAGLESHGVEAIQSLSTHRLRVPQSVRVNDYNHRRAGVGLVSEVNRARGDGTTQGREDRWGEHHADRAEGAVAAGLRHEAHLATQLTFRGTGNVIGITPGTVLNLADGNPPEAPHGLLITAVAHEAARDSAYSQAFTAIPSDRIFRTPPLPWPRIAGILPARVDSPDHYQYAHLTPEGWYRIRLPFDLDGYSPGGRSRPVRLARPYGGRDYGHHFPLIDGAEVALAFTDGDPDRPIIIGALHDSDHPDLVTSQNHTRNRLRTAGGNELRMEDRAGQQHVHLTTPVETSELNLGHLVDGDQKRRGVGAELRTDGHAVVRGAKGVLISAEGQVGAVGNHLEMTPALEQLKSALKRMKEAVASATAAKADLAQVEQQSLLLESLDALSQAVIVAYAPAGMALVSASHMELAANENLTVSVAGHTDIGAMENFTVVAGEAISLLACESGIKAFASHGAVDIQAQSGELRMMSLGNMEVASVQEGVQIVGKKSVTISSGGAYIKLEGGGIEIGAPGEILLKTPMLKKVGAEKQLVERALSDSARCDSTASQAGPGNASTTEIR